MGTLRRTLEYLVLSGMAAWLLAGGCLARAQNELEWMFAPEAANNSLFIRHSVLYQLFGTKLFELFL